MQQALACYIKDMNEIPHIVIIGGGAGGLELATMLGHRFGKHRKANITLVDRSLTHVWKPLLHEVAAGTLDTNENEVNYITHAHAHHFQFQAGELIGLNRNAQTVTISFQPLHNKDLPGYQQTLHYDILIIAIGSISNNYDIPGTDKYCYYLDSSAEAKNFQQFLLNQIIGQQQLDTVIVGGGATGVELSAELYYALQQAAVYGLKHLSAEHNIKITIIEAAERILSALPERVTKLTMIELKRRCIDVITDERVTKVTEQGVYTQSGKFIPAALKIWAAGIRGPKILTQLDGLETNANRQLVVKPTLQTTCDDNIFAFGDSAACPLPNGKIVPARAQAAHQQASLLVKSIANVLAGKAPLEYRYRDYGSLISLSKKGTAGNLMGKMLKNVLIEGLIARLFYVSLHKMHEVKLHGWWRVMIISFAKLLTCRVKPKLKLH